MSNISLTTLGGVRENGKNMYIAEIGESIFVLNVGLKYPENEQLGVDVVIPNMDYLFENSDRIAGVFLTHGMRMLLVLYLISWQRLKFLYLGLS